MGKWVPKAARYYTIAVILLGFVALVFFLQPKPLPPLPFDASGFVAAAGFKTPAPPPNASFYQRVRYCLDKLDEKIEKATHGTWSFPPSAPGYCLVDNQLNYCTEISGTRYLKSKEIGTDAFVVFGHTNVLDGPQFIRASEDALQHGDVSWWNSDKTSYHKEQFALLRFPEQMAVVVLPKSEVADFLRTNGIDPRRFESAPVREGAAVKP